MTISANELFIFLQVILSFTFIQMIFRVRKSLLFASIALNLILVSIFGSKLIHILGFTTNAGNVFYAMVFFATQLLIENFGVKEAKKAIFLGASAILFFMIMSQLTIMMIGTQDTYLVNFALTTLFSYAPRVAIGSLVAFICAQTINISIYEHLRIKTQGKMLPLRVITSTVIAQFADSILFFAIAFYNIVDGMLLIELALTGYVIKVLIGCFSLVLFNYNITDIQPLKKKRKQKSN